MSRLQFWESHIAGVDTRTGAVKYSAIRAGGQHSLNAWRVFTH